MDIQCATIIFIILYSEMENVMSYVTYYIFFYLYVTVHPVSMLFFNNVSDGISVKELT